MTHFPFRLPLVVALILAAVAGCGRMGDPIPPGQALLEPPGAPQLRGRGDRLIVSWEVSRKTLSGKSAAEGTTYRVERNFWPPGEEFCENCPDTPATTHEAGTNSWTDADLVEGGTYRYRVFPVDHRSRTGRPSPWSLITWRTTAPPSQATGTGFLNGVKITSTPPPATEGTTPVGLAVYSSDDRLLQQIPAGVEEGEITGLENDVAVEFSLRWSVKTRQGWVLESSPVNIAAVPRDIIPPTPPTDLVAFPEADAIGLHWLPSRGEPYEALVIERSTDLTQWREVARLEGGQVNHPDTSAEPGILYYYRVYAVDRAGNASEPSPTASAKVEAEEGRR